MQTTVSPVPPAADLGAGVRAPRPELLAPAGDWDCARAAVENGADAIYFGLERFNARMRAHNFTEADLPALMDFLHRRGVRGYVTLNTLVFQDELAEAEHYVWAVIAAGVDAAIVQDVGIARLIRRLSPDFPIHASTQMTITSAAGVEFARELGCDLVVLARECSLREIEAIRQQEAQATSGGAGNGAGGPETPRPMPLEVFVHGALCVAYSGQCLTSEALGGRSANRGECAQACRMPYELIADGKPVPLGDRRYLLSPQDLAGLEVMPELLRTGVASLKIEGRLKTPEYVANITRIYRTALDRAAAGLPSADPAHDAYEMQMAFSRGLHSGWFRGINNQELVHARFGKKRGVFLGRVTRVQGDQVAVDLVAPLKPGDGVVFDAGHPEQPEEGGRVYQVSPMRAPAPGATGPGPAWLRFGRQAIDCSKVHPGDRLWKTSDPELERRLRQSFAGDKPRFHRPIDCELHGKAGQPLQLTVRDELGHVVRRNSAMPLARADKQPLSEERLRDHLGRLGSTGFKLGTLRSRLEGEVILPISELNRLRREAVTELEQLRRLPKRWSLREPGSPPAKLPASSTVSRPPELVVLVRDPAQLEAALQCDIRTVYCEFENPKRYGDAVRLVRTAGGAAGSAPTVWVAPPRIFKTGEEWTLQQVRACEADGYLVRNYDHLKAFAGARRVGDFSLNVANALSADYFMTRFGLERLTASYDLNGAQLEALLLEAPPEWFEITIHQHMPMFHMEHCVFCAFLSQGTDYTNCGRPCDKHQVRLRDRVGAEHPLRADVGCRNTVFNAAAQTGAELVPRLLALGIRFFRVEFVHESPLQVRQILTQYGKLLRGEITGTQLWRELKLVNQLGVTRGTLE